jgi:all-trans-retinol 13,14-reductase
MPDYDDIVIGSGMGGLTVGSLLAKSGRRVLVLEAHDTPGGYAHSFRMRDFKFCAQVHYIFNCGEGESVHNLLAKLGVADEVTFVRLDPEGFDHVVIAGERTRIPNGLPKFRERLVRRFPEAREPLRRYFDTISTLRDELDLIDDLPASLGPLTLARAAVRMRHVLRYYRSTLEDLFDHIHMPQPLRAILAGQAGDYLLPPRDVSLLLHVALVSGYDKGAYYPKRHFFHFIETITKAIAGSAGSTVLLEHEVDRIHVENGRVLGVSSNGRRYTAERYISNLDPKLTLRLAGVEHFDRRDVARTDYAYSSSTFNVYLGISGLDLREHGFGSHNVWHYPHDDLNRCYDDQLVRNDLSDPWMFLSTPSLHSDEPGICPPGTQILEVATSCSYPHFAALRQRDRRAYNLEKKKIRERIEEILEERYVPNLRQHITMRVTGSPTTNERYCRAPAGNAYGSALVPANLHRDRRPLRSSVENLWMVNATAGFPSIAGTVGAGIRLYEELSSDRV